jgi:hypothetical protein
MHIMSVNALPDHLWTQASPPQQADVLSGPGVAKRNRGSTTPTSSPHLPPTKYTRSSSRLKLHTYRVGTSHVEGTLL